MFPLLLIPLLLSPSTSSSSLSCSSLPEFDEFSSTLYFACTCPEEMMAGHFSLASFAHNLSQDIFDRSLVVDFRDCWSLDIIMDQLQLHSVQSQNFRPDFQFKEVNVENIFQVHLVQSPPTSSEGDYINYPTHPLSVHLYSVNKVMVDPAADLDRLTTEWELTKLHIDLTTQHVDKEDYNFDIAGFKHSNIFFITDENKVELKEISEFQDVFHNLRTAVLTRSKQMSLGLGLCVFVLALGVGAMMLATIKRHQLLIESVVYSSIGSLRRIKDKNYLHQKEKKPIKQSEPESQTPEKTEKDTNTDITTTTTQVDFFPRYSVVNKSQRGVPRHLIDSKTVENLQSKQNVTIPKKSSDKLEITKQKSHTSSINEIFSTLKFPTKRKSQNIPAEVSKGEITKPDASFYYQRSSSDSGSRYDLTLGKNTSQVAAQGHQNTEAKHKDTDLDYTNINNSPEPLIPVEKVYSFMTLREKCRKMIAGSKPFPDSTKL